MVAAIAYSWLNTKSSGVIQEWGWNIGTIPHASDQMTLQKMG